MPVRCLLALVALLALGGVRPLEAASQQAIDAAVKSGARYLASTAPTGAGTFASGYESLRLYALLKAKYPKDSPVVRSLLEGVLTHFRSGEYTRPGGRNQATYTAGLDAMILLEIDAKKYRPQLVILRDYLLAEQLDNGGFNYDGKGTDGDTSVSQYGMLGLWAVERAGIEVPTGAFDACARWHLVHRQASGGFAYTPKIRGNEADLNMTVAGLGSLGIARLYLKAKSEARSNNFAVRTKAADDQETAVAAIDPGEPPVRYGVRFPIVPEDVADSGDAEEAPPEPEQLPKEAIVTKEADLLTKEAVSKGMIPPLNYLNRAFTPTGKSERFNAYYYYALERAAALSELEQIAGQDWFDVCSTEIVGRQQSDGAWLLGDRHDADTAFCILFLTRSTRQLVGPPRKKDSLFGGGLLLGGRGLPADLSQYGKAAPDERRIETPLEKMLSDLASADATDLPDLQKKLVEEVKIGDHSKLIGQSERLIELSGHGSADVRRVAVWAMGRTGELPLARHVLPMFDDPSPAVLTEARNAMAWIARRPDAYGIPEYPPRDDDGLSRWRRAAWIAWGDWFLEQSPYGQRLDEFELDLQRRLDDYKK